MATASLACGKTRGLPHEGGHSTAPAALRDTALDGVTGVGPIVVQARRGVGCFDIRNNGATFPNGNSAGIIGIRARQVAPGAANLEQGISAGTAAVVLAANNPATTTEVLGTVNVVNNNTCSPPPS